MPLKYLVILPALVLFNCQAAFANDALIQSLIGVGGAIILNEMQKSPQNNPPPKVYNAPGNQSTHQGASKAAETKALRMEIQNRLNILGFNAGTPDGIFGPNTRKAIAQFQLSIGATPDGKISESQIATLYQQTNSGGVQGQGFASLNSASPTGTPNSAASGTSSEFPQLGVGQSGNKQPASAFPSLGNAGGNSESSESAFPQIASGGGGQNTSDAGFPALGKPQDQEQATAFPLLNAQEAPGEPTMPEIAAGQSEAAPALTTIPLGTPPTTSTLNSVVGSDLIMTDLETELAKTPFKDRDASPDVLGLTLGGDLDSSILLIESEGFDGCNELNGYTTCERKTSNLNDEIRLWANDGGALFAIHRRIVLKKPAPAEFVVGQFTETYPKIMGAQSNLISSSLSCSLAKYDIQELHGLPNKLGTAFAGEQHSVDHEGLMYAVDCPVVFHVRLEGQDDISQADVLFVDATGIVAAAIEQRDLEAQAKSDAEEALSKDLKL